MSSSIDNSNTVSKFEGSPLSKKESPPPSKAGQISKEILSSTKTEGNKNTHTFSKVETSENVNSLNKAHLVGLLSLQGAEKTRTRSNALAKNLSLEQREEGFKIAASQFIQTPSDASLKNVSSQLQVIGEQVHKEKTCSYDLLKSVVDELGKILGNAQTGSLNKASKKELKNVIDRTQERLKSSSTIKITSDFPQANSAGMQAELRKLFSDKLAAISKKLN